MLFICSWSGPNKSGLGCPLGSNIKGQMLMKVTPGNSVSISPRMRMFVSFILDIKATRDWKSTSTVSTSTNTCTLINLLWTFVPVQLLKYNCTKYQYLVQMYLSTSTKY